MYIGWGLPENSSWGFVLSNVSRDARTSPSVRASARGPAAMGSCARLRGRKGAFGFVRNLLFLLDMSLDLELAGGQFARHPFVADHGAGNKGTFLPKLQIP